MKEKSLEKLKEVALATTVHDVALSSRRPGRVWAACLDGGIWEVDLETGSVEELGRHDRYASGVHVLPGEEVLVSAGYDGRLRWHDLETRQCFREVQAHSFWSWQSALSPDGTLVASVTGQYRCGGYRYEPAPEPDGQPSVKVYDTLRGDLRGAFSLGPPVQAVAFSGDGRYLAAGNLMGDVRIWEVATGEMVSGWNTGDFTGWGIIKGHYFTGGVFALAFGPGDERLYLAGMGSTRDPAAGNGRQMWQAYAWRDGTGEKVGETAEAVAGQGLMETLGFAPSGKRFLMAGRLESGQWNVGVFEEAGGGMVASGDFKGRVCRGLFLGDQERFLLAGGISQDGLQEGGRFRDFGRIWLGEVREGV